MELFVRQIRLSDDSGAMCLAVFKETIESRINTGLLAERWSVNVTVGKYYSVRNASVYNSLDISERQTNRPLQTQ